MFPLAMYSIFVCRLSVCQLIALYSYKVSLNNKYYQQGLNAFTVLNEVGQLKTFLVLLNRKHIYCLFLFETQSYWGYTLVWVSIWVKHM